MYKHSAAPLGAEWLSFNPKVVISADTVLCCHLKYPFERVMQHATCEDSALAVNTYVGKQDCRLQILFFVIAVNVEQASDQLAKNCRIELVE
jgi:hypothetical protein